MGEALEKEEDWPENVFRKRRKRKCKFNAFCFSRAAYVLCTLFVHLHEPVKRSLLCVSHLWLSKFELVHGFISLIGSYR